MAELLTTPEPTTVSKKMKLRDYQLELYLEIEKRRSCILFLPTGSGKTHIAFWLIRSMAADLKKPVSEGGKRTFFLVNTVQLVQQQAALLMKLGNFSVICLSGDTGVDSFNGDKWTDLEKEYEVFVMTTQVYLDALNSAFLSLKNANLLIIDECHHATRNHPMAMVMKLVNACTPDTKPKVLGLSATLLNANVKKQSRKDFAQKLIDLEALFDGEIITAKNCHEIRSSFSAKPKEFIEPVLKYPLEESTASTIKRICDSAATVLTSVQLKDNIILDAEEQNDIQLHKPGQNRSKLLYNALKDIVAHMEDYGLHLAFTCCQCYIIQLYRYVYSSCEPRYIDMILYTVNLAQMMRKVLHTSILQSTKCGVDGFKSVDTILGSSSGKIKYLFEQILQLKATDRCIVFVQKKMTAKSLYKVIKLVTANRTDCDISVDFIVGSDSNPLRNTREGMYDKKKQKEILENFRNGSTNLLVATDVVEEGIDVQQCNLVIMFDRIRTFRSYIQSKGRARMPGSKYIILNDEETPVDSLIDEYRHVDSQLDRIIDEKDILDFGEDDSESSSSEAGVEEYITETGARATSVSAVSKIYQYCSILPRDLFTDLIPYWFYNPDTGTCKLKLPANAGIRLQIRGPARANCKEAKQAAALEGVRQLHQQSLLNERLLPIRIPKEVLDTDYWFPNWDVEDAEKLKADKSGGDALSDKVFTSQMRIPVFLRHSRPLPRTKCHLHVIQTKTEYETPTIPRQKVCDGLMQLNEYPFGILTRERLPPICEFPAYSDLGEIRITIAVNARVFEFTEEELLAISKFHRTLFLDVLRVVPKCLSFDTEDDSNGYYVVPLKRGKDSDIPTDLAWKCIRKQIDFDTRRPSDEEIRKQNYTDDNYVGKVITPWYRPLLRFIVCDLPGDMTLSSKFNEAIPSYAEYFSNKYNLIALRPEQPLLHVRPITQNYDGIIPKPVSSSMKGRRKNGDNETYLPPEYCHMFSFPSVYWYKSIILPSVLHRMFHLLLAEDLRQKIVIEAGLGSLQMPQGDVEDTLAHFKAVVVTTKKSEDSDSTHKSLGRDPRQKAEKVENEPRIIKDIERELDVNMDDIKRYAEYVNAPLLPKDPTKKKTLSDYAYPKQPEKLVPTFVESPVLMTLKKRTVVCGPKPHQILEALTLRTAADSIHLERLETLGDSAMKYLVSISTFIECRGLNEGHLTCLKGRLVSNQNLFYCGKKLDIASYVKSTVFSARDFWFPPGFSMPRVLEERYTGDHITALLGADIPHDEQFSGDVSEQTIEKILSTDVVDFMKERTAEERIRKDEREEKRIQFYLGRQELRRKNLSDVLEALLGVYLQTCGLGGCFQLLKYYGIPNKASNLEELYDKNLYLPTPDPTSGKDVMGTLARLLPDYKTIERVLNYEFKEKHYLLQAFTHPSYSGHNVTDCYQKLEFIGDAVLDFLITSYIYEYCGNLNPGELTDLRSSLVNNNTFGALVVRLQLHRYLLHHSQRLTVAMDKFVVYQEDKNYEIHGNELVRLVNENDTEIAEEVDVPKALGDIFESLAGAIFLDSGCNPLAVWRVYYNIMKDEIAKFSHHIPINPVRALYEKAMEQPSATQIAFCSVNIDPATLPVHLKEKLVVILTVSSKSKVREYRGRGDNKKTAKRAAAKFALRDLNYCEFVI